jgi:hypothetical protein
MPTAEQGDTATLSEEARSWLEAAAAPGRTSLRLAGTCQALETVFTVVQWAALAWVAQGVRGRRAQPTWPELGVLFASGLLAGGRHGAQHGSRPRAANGSPTPFGNVSWPGYCPRDSGAANRTPQRRP